MIQSGSHSCRLQWLISVFELLVLRPDARNQGISTNGSRGNEFAKALTRLNLGNAQRFLARIAEALRQAKV
jgi:hypothetical protein